MDVAAWITAVATVGLVLVGAWAGWAAVRTLKQARSDSEARTRPYITVDLAPGLHGAGAVDVIIRNGGQSATKDLAFQIAGWPLANPEDKYVPLIRKALDARFNLVPGGYRRLLWINTLMTASPIPATAPKRMGMPNLVTVTVSYNGTAQATGSKKRGPAYTESFSLDAQSIYASPAPSAGPDAAHDMDPALRKIYQGLQLVAQNVRMIGFDR
jgi:hypothetical protein